MNVLSLQHLSKHYGGVQVLHDISLDIRAGERVAIIGPNGAGKTTLLTTITGAQRASGGRIELFGREVTNAAANERARLGLGSSFQLNRLFFGLSVLENVLLALQGVHRSQYALWRDAHTFADLNGGARQLLASVALDEKRNVPVGTLAYGEQRKLEIVLGLALEPKLLVMDEPTAGLALNEVTPFLQTIRNLAVGTTVLFTSHDMDVVFGLADRVIALYYGKLIAQGTPDEIQNNAQVREIYLGAEELNDEG